MGNKAVFLKGPMVLGSLINLIMSSSCMTSLAEVRGVVLLVIIIIIVLFNYGQTIMKVCSWRRVVAPYQQPLKLISLSLPQRQRMKHGYFITSLVAYP